MNNSEQLSKLKNSRKTIKSTFTRFKNAFEKLKNEQPPDINQIELRLFKIESILQEFNTIQTEIEEIDSLTVLDEHENERNEFENSYFEIVSQVNQFISENKNQNSNASIKSGDSIPIEYNKNIKLPSISLPNFDGNYDQWLFYKDSFISLIHENPSIPLVHKFHYLRLSLKGDAADLLKSLECSAANYSVAWSLLIERYENKQILVKNHIKAIFDLEAATKETHSCLRKLADGLSKHLRALEALGQPVDSWDVLIIHIISLKLDRITRREWEKEYNKLTSEKKEVTREMFSNFLLEKCKLLETLGISDDTCYNKNNFNHKAKVIKSHSAVNDARVHICNFCNEQHRIYNCKDFLSLNISDRLSEVKRLNLCVNCLNKNHQINNCKFSSCRKCQRRHNTLLHFETSPQTKSNTTGSFENSNTKHSTNVSNKPQVENKTVQIPNEVSISHMSHAFSTSGILLSTALAYVFDACDNAHQCRILLDSGSQSDFISHSLCNKLGIPLSNVEYTISGIGQTKTKVFKKASIRLQSKHNAFDLHLDCLVLPHVTSNVPSISIDVSHLKIPSNIVLADPTFNEVGSIDILIGANKFWELIIAGQIKLGNNLPTLQKTHFGWIVTGAIFPSKYLNSHMVNQSLCNFSQTSLLDAQLTKFWEIEEINLEKPLSPEEQMCEESFKNDTIRDSSGRFIVTLPLRHSPTILGNSLQMATKRFLLLEKRLHQNSKLREEYSNFLSEYESLNHMSKVDINSIDTNQSFFLPHHCVLKETSITTRLRVVFDGSAKSTSNYSLNDILMTGPTVQEDLFSIILRSRKHNILLTGDIEKMYRQVLVRKDQRHLQIILWRPDPSFDIQYYTLNTLTYGTAPASYLSTRCIKELANLNEIVNPKISSILAKDFYVDDLVTGGQTIEEVKFIKSEISNILKSGGFSLRKFLSNSIDVLVESNSSSDTTHQFADTQGKTLGLLWDSNKDQLCYSIKLQTEDTIVSKRSILSIISQIFDPLGLLAPTIVIAKIIIQKLWLCKLNWDEVIPLELHTEWTRFYNELQLFNQLKIPRHVLCNYPSAIEIHSFSDASESAYGTCIYLKSIDSLGYSHVHLLCAKTRVAPLKTITIPRLELSAALLSAELTSKVKGALNIKIDKCYHWCDSTIVLSWIKAPPHLWKIFVSNRVTQIQSLTDINSWYYVNTKQNPADLLSRGVLPSNLVNNQLWWRGPSWLSISAETVHSESLSDADLCNLPEFRSKMISLATTDNIKHFELIDKYSDLNKLIRITAYCQRFYNNIKLSMSKKTRICGPLSPNETNFALNSLINFIQNQEFAQDIKHLIKFGQVSSKSKLSQLCPFIDNVGLLRVGGRIKHSNFPYNKKFPAILPVKHKLSLLIAQREHIRLMHAGPQTTLASIRDKFWILSGRNLIKKVIRNCTRCFRFAATPTRYKMGDLPAYRLKSTRPFFNAGLDYCGPFNIKDRSTRNYKSIKIYICLFICLSTKAIHLELVSSLSTQAFLATLRRFFARRGLSANLYSDNSTTFVGADNELKKFIHKHQNQIQSELISENVTWHFIPPRAPNFGGLWEAGVKSTKFHLKRVLMNTILNYEEFQTVLVQIEACLNSRPLYPMSTDPNDPDSLTPGHFLIGTKLTTIPEDNYINVQENRLHRFQLTQKLMQHFWTRWSKECISEMQQRVKWKTTYKQLLKPGVVVLVKEDNLPPLKWQLGVVQSVHPGSDGIIRAATIKTSTSVYKRPATKLCTLPNFDDEEESLPPIGCQGGRYVTAS